MIDPPPPRSRSRGRTLAALLAVGAFAGGVVVGGHPRSTGINRLPADLRGSLQEDAPDAVAAEVLGLLTSGYYTRVDASALQRASIDGMVRALDDRYSMYLDPAQYAELQRHTDAVFFGVGMVVRSVGRFTTVSSVYDDTPAQKAGVAAGDRIVSVDGKNMVGAPRDAVVAAVRGPEGTRVVIVFRRAGVDRTVTLTRARIKIPLTASRLYTRRGATVGYVRLAEFDRGAAAQLRSAVVSLQRRGATRLVFDLRGDPGGLVDEAVGVVGVFMPSGSPVVTTQGLHRPRETLKTSGKPATTLPLVVLVDRDSASSSEIVTGALRDGDRATVVGTRTFGKALVQTTRELRNGGALRFTTARYVTPDGVDVSKTGLKPDVQAQDDPKTPVDEALEAALARAAASR